MIIVNLLGVTKKAKRCIDINGNYFEETEYFITCISAEIRIQRQSLSNTSRSSFHSYFF
jgi:hypothetical protein